MQVTDSLDAGGLERVAVNLSNVLPRSRFVSSLCATRHEGSLSRLVAQDVKRLCLHRSSRYDLKAIKTLLAFIRANEVKILHAHGTSLFVAVAAALFQPGTIVIWHDHFGAHLVATRPRWAYMLALRRVAGVIAVSPALAAWSRGRGVPADRVWYIPNFVRDRAAIAAPSVHLPGEPGARVACVAQFRMQKDHLTLIRAWAVAVELTPLAHLILVGSGSDERYLNDVRAEIRRLDLSERVTLLGERDDVQAILRACDVGVLSSVSEGFPLALVEYGIAGLATVATDVGQSAEVLDGGAAGLLVSPGDAMQLGAALGRLLRDAALRTRLGVALRRHVTNTYNVERIVQQISTVYDVCRGSQTTHT